MVKALCERDKLVAAHLGQQTFQAGLELGVEGARMRPHQRLHCVGQGQQQVVHRKPVGSAAARCVGDCRQQFTHLCICLTLRLPGLGLDAHEARRDRVGQPAGNTTCLLAGRLDGCGRLVVAAPANLGCDDFAHRARAMTLGRCAGCAQLKVTQCFNSELA
ncbi:hypothetical protein [Caenimonas koreensis]|uniref:hypothetical protein n=1 Tax=Caenimonas koreensis TaxID=367474 RepID=UPI003784F9E2